MNNPADYKGMDGKATQGREHDESSQTENTTSLRRGQAGTSLKKLTTRLDAIEKKNHENEHKITSHQTSIEELIKRISEVTATEGKKSSHA